MIRTVIVSVLAMAALVAADPVAAVPDKPAVDAARQALLKSLGDLAMAKRGEERMALAKIVADTARIATDPAERIAAQLETIRLSIAADDVVLPLKALEDIGSRFPTFAPQAWSEAAAATSTRTLVPEAYAAFASGLVEQVEAQEAARAWDAVAALGEPAGRFAAKVQDPVCRDALTRAQERIAGLTKERGALAASAAKPATGPDPAGTDAGLRWALLMEADKTEVARLAPLAADKALSAAATAWLAPDAPLAAADALWDLATATPGPSTFWKHRLRQTAAERFRAALPQAQGIQRARIELRLLQVDGEARAKQAELVLAHLRTMLAARPTVWDGRTQPSRLAGKNLVIGYLSPAGGGALRVAPGAVVLFTNAVSPCELSAMIGYRYTLPIVVVAPGQVVRLGTGMSDETAAAAGSRTIRFCDWWMQCGGLDTGYGRKTAFERCLPAFDAPIGGGSAHGLSGYSDARWSDCTFVGVPLGPTFSAGDLPFTTTGSSFIGCRIAGGETEGSRPRWTGKPAKASFWQKDCDLSALFAEKIACTGERPDAQALTGDPQSVGCGRLLEIRAVLAQLGAQAKPPEIIRRR
jgi:hypothetical protein